MRLLMASVAVVFLGAGCATGTNAPNAGLTDNGRVAGVIKLPEQLASGSNVCDRISVVALSGESQVGRTTVRQSRARCSYEISNLPANAELGLQVKVDGLQCANGASATGSSKNVTLKDGEIKTTDLETSCG